MTDAMRGRAPGRRGIIVAAARRLVLRQGLRATTMEAIAREAGVAKPTLYAYFPHKQAVVSAHAEAMAADAADAFTTALADEGSAVTRIGNAIAAKHRTLARLLGNSQHANALAAEGEHAAALRALEERIETRIAEELARAGAARALPLARLLLAAADGIARKATAPAEIGPAVRLLTERLLRPEIGNGR